MNEPASDSTLPKTIGTHDELARKLAERWQHGQPDLREFSAQAGQLSAQDRLAVVRVDQEQRWQRGERVLVEGYLDQLPQLRGDETATLELIYREVEQREKIGATPKVAEYTQR